MTTPQSNKIATPSPNKSSTINTHTRLRSPRGSSPRGSSMADSYLFALLRHTKGMLTAIAVVAFFTMQHRPTIETRATSHHEPSYHYMPTTMKGLDNGVYNDDIAVESVQDTPPQQQDTDHSSDDTDIGEILDLFELEDVEEPLVVEETALDAQIIAEDDEPAQDSKTREKILSSYNASLHPVFKKPENIQVHLITDVSHSITPPSKFLLDGLERSDYVRVLGMTFLNPRIKTVQMKSKKSGLPMVWMVDWGSMNRDCHRLKRVLDHLNRKSSEKVVLMDFSASSRQTQCDFWNSNVRVAKRSIVQGRYYDFEKEKMVQGKVVQNDHKTIHAPLVLREKFFEVLYSINKNVLKERRSIDVSFFWKVGDFSHYGFGRRAMSKVVKTLYHAVSNNRTLETFTGIAANEEEGMLEGHLQLEYIQKLASSKIVVIAQRDEWEDHYRLFESMASGALVMTDPMLAPPAGLKDETNIIFYDSPKTLKRLISYYLKYEDKRLAIAKAGYELAVGRHRSWHRIEEVLFGRPLTHVDRPYDRPSNKVQRPQTKLVEEDVSFAR